MSVVGLLMSSIIVGTYREVNPTVHNCNIAHQLGQHRGGEIEVPLSLYSVGSSFFLMLIDDEALDPA